jgi:hypothetical protein
VLRRDVLTGNLQARAVRSERCDRNGERLQSDLGYEVVFNGNQNHVTYEATLGEDGTLTGTLHLDPTPPPFTAVRL